MRHTLIFFLIVVLFTNHPSVGDGFVAARGPGLVGLGLGPGEGQPVGGTIRKLLAAPRCPSSMGFMLRRWSQSVTSRWSGRTIASSSKQLVPGDNLQSRKLFQAPSNTTIVPVAATAPLPETAPVSPFSPAPGGSGSSGGGSSSNVSNNNGTVCCCNGNGQIVQIPYQQPTPPGCCCGDPNSCCPSGNLVVLMCGGGTVCIVLMLLSVFAAIAILTLCTLGAFISHRRRRRAIALAAANGENGEGNPSGVDSLRYSRRSRVPNINIPADQLDSFRVRPPSPEEQGCNKECPICLESISIEKDNWVVMPCSHGCCKTCLGDLLRLSSRTVQADTQAFLCPLCRKIAAADREPRVEEADVNEASDTVETAAVQEEPVPVTEGQRAG